MWPWLAAALFATGFVAAAYPHQVGVLMWGLTKLCWGAGLGYWIDRTTFPRGRVGDYVVPVGELTGHWREAVLWVAMQARRAAIMAACMLALGLGV